jgi:hypothetical protein
MGSFILSGNAGAGEFWPLGSEAETVARFQITPRATIDVEGECDGSGCIVTAGSQLSGFIKNNDSGVLDTRLYVGTGNRNFEFSITAGYTHLFGTEMLTLNDGFVFGGAIEFNPIFFITRQPIWLMVGYDCRLFIGSDDTNNTHMVWAGLSLMLDWLWNPARYA